SMMVHDVGTGRGGIEAALGRVSARTLVVDVDSDRLFLSAQAEELERGIAEARRATISSLHGHDGFLIEADQMDAILRDFLAGA
ncbi:MAG: homoserine O-acetyltransferase, partial [Actinomyces bowdenii]|nr:homoserine O-acetyltransferase [Actinomyces bowdenii]